MFLGIVFLMLMTLTMVYVASAMDLIREEEAEGYLDNLLFRQVGRLRWLLRRLVIRLVTSVAVWAGTASQHSGIRFHTILLAPVTLLL